MEILIYSLEKDLESKEIKEYMKMSSKWAKIRSINKFSSKISKAQAGSKKQAQKAYDEAYKPYVSGYCVGLDERGLELGSQEFADILKNSSKISFFIGGAYGLSEEFKARMNILISLSKMTLAHKIARLVLFEQIFRGLCINAKHPYHKGDK